MIGSSARDWVRANGSPISTADPAAPDDDDLLSVLEVIGDARIVGLGESTHGTREFSLLKDRIIRSLVRRAGFRVVALERDVPLVAHVGAYVSGHDRDQESVFSLWNTYPWQTEEFRDCVGWLRGWNRDAAGAVRFLGFDMQAPDQSLDMLGSEPDAELIRALFAEAGSADPADEEKWHRLAERARAASGQTDDGLASLCFLTLAQHAQVQLDTLAAPELEEAGLLARERAMAENIEVIADRLHPDDRVVIWAHNGHVGRYEGAMGSYLHQRFGASYRPIGFTFDHGSYAGATLSDGKLDRRLRPFEASALESGSAEELLRVESMPMYAIDFRTPDLPAEFLADRPHRQIGFIGGLDDRIDEPLARVFDALVHIEVGTAARPLPWSDDEISAVQSR